MSRISTISHVEVNITQDLANVYTKSNDQPHYLFVYQILKYLFNYLKAVSTCGESRKG